MDALYFRVSSERQTTENQFEDLLQIAERDGSGRDWNRIRADLSKCVIEEQRQGPSGITTVYRIAPEFAEKLSRGCVYVEQGRSSKIGAKARPLFEQMKRDAAARKFDRLLVWKVSRLGRNMREVINTVYELADHGVTVYPLKSQTGPINSAMGKLLWAIQAWYAEMENEERSEAVQAGQARARAAGKHVGRPKVVFDRASALKLRNQGRSWSEIAKSAGVSVGSVRRAVQNLDADSVAC
jgi:DNA invertase Pin-like site-specific DNA recombinase